MSNFDQAMYNPSLMYEGSRGTSTWSEGNTLTVTNPNVRADSIIVIHHTTVPAGRWSIACSAGSFVITSSDSESDTCTFKYEIL